MFRDCAIFTDKLACCFQYPISEHPLKGQLQGYFARLVQSSCFGVFPEFQFAFTHFSAVWNAGYYLLWYLCGAGPPEIVLCVSFCEGWLT